MKYMSVGHKVLVMIPDEDKQTHAAVVKYHGQEMKIADRKAINKRDNYVYYKLVGAESDYGIPYSFIRDWLIPL